MPNTWFTSDSHFGHKNILEYEKEARPFKTVEEMNETIINRWNGVVGTNDIVWHLGDFCFGKANLAIAKRLNGKKRLVLGNHDHYPSNLYLESFDALYGVFYWKQCVLSHMPVHPNGLGSRWFLNVHGHLHSKRVMEGSKTIIPFEDRNYFNVSCEQNNLTPIHADIIFNRLKELRVIDEQ